MNKGISRRSHFPRYNTYRSLMRSRQRWDRILAIITCKKIRDGKKPGDIGKLVDLLNDTAFRQLVQDKNWHLVFTGGTFEFLEGTTNRISEFRGRVHSLAPSALGVIQIANLVVYGHVFGVAFFNHMEDLYADSPQNLCLRRICNDKETPLFEDATSIEYILRRWESGHHRTEKDPSDYPKKAISEYYGVGPCEDSVISAPDFSMKERLIHPPTKETLAVVSHDKQKMEMLNFCLEHLTEILSYRRVISTGTTGHFLRQQMVVALKKFAFDRATRRRWGWKSKQSVDEFLARKIQPLASGPRGGDVQISAKVIDGTCHRILFFQDPQSAHPHQFDIRLMEKAVQDSETGALFATSTRTAKLIMERPELPKRLKGSKRP